MSRDTYEHRHTFEESGPFPDFKALGDKVVTAPSRQTFICATSTLYKDKIERVSMKGLTAEEHEKGRHFMFCIDKDCKICKDAGLRDRTIFSDKEIEDIKEKFPNLSDYEYLKLLNK